MIHENNFLKTTFILWIFNLFNLFNFYYYHENDETWFMADWLCQLF